MGNRDSARQGEGGNGFARAVAFVVGLFVFVVVAMIDLFVLLGYGGAAESCADEACRSWYDSRAPWTLGLFALSFVATLIGLELTKRLERRRFAIGLPIVAVGLALQAAGLSLFQGAPAT
ncbi:hypothetical protein [Embleya sp. NBC_00896]|uniref:hypothetical protein n=1 Tax=Embleya sp. NBC_00896 TaxID=2975961 RepID=UPI00386759F5|nr:hypothetical protein OG928_22420 [Embleya sp. NBC_00896]